MPADRNAADVLTHHARLILDSDEGLYHERLRMVEEARADEYPASTLADALKDLVYQLVYGYDEDEDTLSMMAREMLGVAVASIDYHDMATDYIAETDR